MRPRHAVTVVDPRRALQRGLVHVEEGAPRGEGGAAGCAVAPVGLGPGPRCRWARLVRIHRVVLARAEAHGLDTVWRVLWDRGAEGGRARAGECGAETSARLIGCIQGSVFSALRRPPWTRPRARRGRRPSTRVGLRGCPRRERRGAGRVGQDAGYLPPSAAASPRRRVDRRLSPNRAPWASPGASAWPGTEVARTARRGLPLPQPLLVAQHHDENNGAHDGKKDEDNEEVHLGGGRVRREAGRVWGNHGSGPQLRRRAHLELAAPHGS